MGRPRKYPVGAPRNREIKINHETYFRDSWVARVQRGRRCNMCRKSIPAGQQSMRFVKEYANARRLKTGGTYSIRSEKAICKECAIEGLKKQLDALNEPDDTTMFLKVKKNNPSKTEW